MGKFNLTLIETPKKTFIFVGSVPIELAYESTCEDALTPKLVNSQLRLPSMYRKKIKTRSFPTYDDGLLALHKYLYYKENL